MRRQSLELNAGFSNLRLGLGLVDFASIPGVPGSAGQTQVRAYLGATLTRYWSMQVINVQTISGSGGNISSGVTLTYQDECLAFVTSLTRSGVTFGDVRPGLSVLFSVVFKNLGEIGVRALSTGGT
jgi:LPS-assembly protein